MKKALPMKSEQTDTVVKTPGEYGIPGFAAALRKHADKAPTAEMKRYWLEMADGKVPSPPKITMPGKSMSEEDRLSAEDLRKQFRQSPIAPRPIVVEVETPAPVAPTAPPRPALKPPRPPGPGFRR